MDEELKRDDKVLVFGEDVGKNGGVSVQLMDFKKFTEKIECCTR